MGEETVINCMGLSCSKPLALVKEHLEKQGDGSFIVLVDSESTCSSIEQFVSGLGHEVSMAQQGGGFQLTVIRRGEPGPDTQTKGNGPGGRGRHFVVAIASDRMGTGDDELGVILMNAYMETLLHFAPQISHITFVNSGVKLIAEGSTCLAHLQELQSMGIELLVCGTCVKFYNLTDKLGAGKVSNMFAILEAQSASAMVLAP